MRPCVAKVAFVVATLVAFVAMPPPTWATAGTKATCETAYFEFWTGEVASDPTGVISHVSLPATVGDDFTLNAGFLGENQFADLAFQDKIDAYAAPYAEGQVSTTTALPISKTGGYTVSSEPFYDDFVDGLSSDNFVVLTQKDSIADNVDIVQDLVDGTSKNVVRLTAVAGTGSDGEPDVASTGIIETANLYTAARFEVVARFPQVLGVVSAVWTFHFELHREEYASEDPQYLSDLSTDGATLTNHEIDMEMPASCPGMCTDGGCTAQWDTMNLNSYRYTNADGEGPAYANLCVRAPPFTQFVDNDYHKYTMEWHTGDKESTTCTPHINFFFDDQYIGSSNVFIPTRGSRLVIGIWGGDANWVGNPMWAEAYAYISSVKITPFDESRSTNYPMIYDEPINHPDWVTKDIPSPTGSVVLRQPAQRQPTSRPRASTPVAWIAAGAGVAAVAMVAFAALVVLAVRRRRRPQSKETGVTLLPQQEGRAVYGTAQGRAPV